MYAVCGGFQYFELLNTRYVYTLTFFLTNVECYSCKPQGHGYILNVATSFTTTFVIVVNISWEQGEDLSLF